MTTEVMEEGGFWAAHRVKIVGLAATGLGLVASVSADIDLNGTIGPILDSVTELIPSIINMVVAFVPAIIVMSIVGFIELSRSKISPVRAF